MEGTWADHLPCGFLPLRPSWKSEGLLVSGSRSLLLAQRRGQGERSCSKATAQDRRKGVNGVRLLEMEVRNFRSIQGSQTKISFEGSNIIFLIGRNNSGKSSLLDAYEYLVTAKKKASLSDFHGFKTERPIEIVATFLKEPGDEQIFKKKGFDRWVSKEGRIRFRKTWKEVDAEGKKETFDPAKNKFVDHGFGGLETHLTKEAPTAIRIPAMPGVNDLDKWVTDTLKKVVLKNLKSEEADAYETALQGISNLQARIYSNTSIEEKSVRANEGFRRVFPDLILLCQIPQLLPGPVSHSLSAIGGIRRGLA